MDKKLVPFSFGIIVGLVIVVGMLLMRPVPTADEYPQFAGPDIASPYMQWGDVYQFNFGPTIQATSSVLCSIQNTHGTSTVDMLGFRANSNGLGAQALYISTSTTAYGSSTPVFAGPIAIPATINAGSPFSTAWLSGGGVSTSSTDVLGALDEMGTSRNGTTVFLWKTGEWITFRLATTSAGTFASYIEGTCSIRSTDI